MSFEGIVQRGTWIARGLGFVFLVYFVTSALREIVALKFPGANLGPAISGEGAPRIALAVSAVTVALAVVFVRLYSRTDDQADRPWKLVRFDRWWATEWLRGAFLGGALASLAVAPIVAMGESQILGLARDAFSRPGAWATTVLILILEAAREEMGFRGPGQRDLTRAVSFPLAALFLSFSFAVIHAGNPDVGLPGMTGIFLAGVGLAGLARARGDLGMVCGVHAAWNIALGMIWSMPVSGHQLDPVLLDTSSNTSIWTGGFFGVEASVSAFVVLLGFAVVTWSLPPALCGEAIAAREEAGGEEARGEETAGA